ncbi:MAG TPA: Gfo/Idh/MocA family oxidoreductase [Acidimicrobiales bacterium]|nr:Gfo/Idh/MocA family oxidoreductase [Acidimicrobiales bacterium]
MSPPRTVAFAGAGWIEAVHAIAAKQLGLTITHVASRDRDKAKEAAARAGAIACTYEDLPAGADVVVVCSAPQCHSVHALHSIRAGAAVVVEKPLCTTLAEADALVEAESAGARIGYAENLAYAPIVQQLLTEVRKMDDLQHLEVRTVQSRPTWGDFLTEAWGGGALFDLGVHPIAIAMLATRLPVVAVSARLDGADDHPTDEHAEVSLRFAGGLRARVVSSWRGGEVPEWSVQAASKTGVVRAELLPSLLLEHNGDEVPVAPASGSIPQLEQYGYVAQLASFLDAFDRGTHPAMDATFGRAVLDIVCASYASARADGDEVAVPFTGPRDRTPLQLWRG